MLLIKRIIVVSILSAAWLAIASSVTAMHMVNDPWQAKLSLSAASKGYTSYDYNLRGSFEWKVKGKSLQPKNRDEKKSYKHKGIGCSSFVAVVLTRMRYGEEWGSKYDTTLYQQNGEGIASAFSLGSAQVTVMAEDLISKSNIGLKEGETYLFDVQKKINNKWNGRHVGFVTVGSKGELTQSQYSGLKRSTNDKYGGHHTGDFKKWFKRTKYWTSHRANARVVFYRIPQAHV